MTEKQPIDRPPLWLLFVLRTTGLTDLVSICTTEGLANRYRDYVQGLIDYGQDEDIPTGYENVIRVWIEPTFANHLLAVTMSSKANADLMTFLQDKNNS